MNNPCGPRPLVQGCISKVDVCGCGTLHVTIGPLTLRLDPAVCADLRSVLAQALRLVGHPVRESASCTLHVVEQGSDGDRRDPASLESKPTKGGVNQN